MATVELANIHKSFGEQAVVSDLSLRVEDGEFLVLVGPSGCGKSSCLRLIAGLESPDAGVVRIDGEDVTATLPKNRDIGMVFQSYALYPHLSVRENLAFGLQLRKVPATRIEERVAEIAGLLQIDGLLGRKPGQLSGGQRQRVAMGRAMVREPRVFLFDEPLSNLDAALRTEMRAELSALHRRTQTTSIYVTHDQVEAMTLGTRIAVLHDGVLQQVDTPLALYERPVNQFVAGFIGTPSMNFVEGTVEGYQGGLSLRSDERWWDLPRATWERLTLGERATLGVRPQRVDIASAGLRADVELVEPMGWDAHLHCRLGQTTVVAQAAAHAVSNLEAGDAVALQIESRDTFVFNSAGKTVAYAEAR